MVSKALSDGNIIILTYVVTNVAEANGARTFTNSGAINTVTDVTTTTIDIARGGSSAESLSSIKFAAPLDYAAQGRCVTIDDYKVYINKFYPSATSVQVFGGEDGSFDSSLGVIDTPDYGKVFISVRNALGTNLAVAEKVKLLSDLKPYTVASITPVIIDPDFLYLLLNVQFKYNTELTTKTKDTLVTEVTDILKSYNTSKLIKFDALFRHSKILETVHDVDDSIESVSVVPRIAKFITPTLNSVKSYRMYFNNALFNPHSGHNADAGGIIISTGFTLVGESNEQFFDDDGKGNLRTYYMSGGSRTYTNSAAGTINYRTGLITISSTTITSVSAVDGASSIKIRITVIPNSNDILALRNQILEIDFVNTSITGAVDTIAVSSSAGAPSYTASASTVTTTGSSTTSSSY